MSARLLDGQTVAAQLRAEAEERAAALAARTGRAPGLVVVRFDDAGATGVYARGLQRAATSAGVEATVAFLSPAADAATVAERIGTLNADPAVSGIVIAEPVPSALRSAIGDLVRPEKDVDGATTTSAGRLARGAPGLAPATALSVMRILRAYQVPIAGRRAVVVGRSPVVGRPVAALLLAADATVVICHRGTRDLAAETRRAEILVVAAGAPGLIGPEMVDPEATVVDCGITATPEGVLGDVAPSVREVAAAVTPVPGGVGPVTAMGLVLQTVEAAEAQARASGRS